MFNPFLETDRLLKLTGFVNLVDYYRSPVSCEPETKIPVLLRVCNQHQTDPIQQYNERSNPTAGLEITAPRYRSTRTSSIPSGR